MDKLELETLCNAQAVEVYLLLTELLQEYEGKPSHSRLMEQGIQFFASHFNLNPSRIMPCMVEGLDIAVISGEQLRTVMPQLQEAGLLRWSRPQTLAQDRRLALGDEANTDDRYTRMLELVAEQEAQGKTRIRKGGRARANEFSITGLAKIVAAEYYPDCVDMDSKVKSISTQFHTLQRE